MVDKPTVADVANTMASGGRSKAYRWMWENYDELIAANPGRVSWAPVVEKFAELEMPVSTETLRKTWRLVKRNKSAVRPAAVPIQQPTMRKTEDARHEPAATTARSGFHFRAATKAESDDLSAPAKPKPSG